MLKLVDPLDVSTEPALAQFKIGSMEIYQFATYECSCGLLRISSNGISGWEDCLLPSCGKKFDLIQWASVFIKIKGLSISDAVSFVRSHQEVWGQDRCELVEAALHDLVRQIQSYDALKSQQTDDLIWERSFLIDQSQSYFSF
jgi:hypothetical protein